MYIILYWYALHMVFNTATKLLLTSQVKCKFSTLTWLDCANLKALHFTFIFPLTARQYLSSSLSGPMGNFVKSKPKKRKI